MQNPTFVICDRCRAEGLAGEDPFEAFGALLDFEPVPRRSNRADGWDAEVQRAYIAALSLTGSDRAACRAVGKSAYGVTQLIAHEGSAGFRAARDEAFAMAADERSRRLAEGVQAVASEQSGWRPPDPPWANARQRGRPPGRAAPAVAHPEPAEESAQAEDQELALFQGLLENYLIKLRLEREARLEGRIVAADFHLRQVSWFEAVIDVASGGDGWRILFEFRKEGHHLIEIAETPMSKLLDIVRRDYWESCGDPPRPERPPEDLLIDHGGFSTEPPEATWGGLEQSHDEQRRVFEERHKQAAADQVLWEEAARRDYEERRASDAVSDLNPPRNGEGDHAKHGGGAGGAAAGMPDEEPHHAPGDSR